MEGLSRRARRRQRGRWKAERQTVQERTRMFAPSFPYYGRPEPIWHMVHPLDLGRPVCATGRLNAVHISNRLPARVHYCEVCAAREHFVAKLAA